MENKTIKQLHEETRELIRQCTVGDDYVKIFYALEQLMNTRDEDFKKAISPFDWEMYGPTYKMIEDALEGMCRKAAMEARTKPEMIKPLRDFFLRPFDKLRGRYDLVAALHDPESVQRVFNRVDEQFKIGPGDDRLDKSCFFGLIEIAKVSGYRNQVLDLVRTSFNRAIHEKKESRLVNDTIYNILGQLCVILNDLEASTFLYDAFVFAADERRNYEMNTVASRLAIYLTALNYNGSLESIKKYIDSFNDSYGDEEFVVRARYAYWWLKKDSTEGLAFLSNAEKKKSLGLVAALLADLDEKRAIPILESRLKSLTNPVTKEIFKEAIYRLTSQKGIPLKMDRMIWMFGFVTETERALGNETDNIFIQRANAATHEDHGRVQEVDESTKDDL
jgi:hypothetical protein